MSRQLSLLMLCGSALWQLATAGPVDPIITPPAVLLPRQENDARFLGYTRSGTVGTYSRVFCNAGLRFGEQGTYARCCAATGLCAPATTCNQAYTDLGYMVFSTSGGSSSASRACTDAADDAAASMCNTAFVYENFGDQGRQTLFFCDSVTAKITYYRNMPPATTTTTTTTADTSLISSSTQAPTTTPATPTQTAEPRASSKAWIAGVIVGPLLGLALIGAGLWFCLRRRTKAAKTPQHSVAAMTPSNSSQPPAGVGGYTDTKPQFQPAQHAYHSPQEQVYPQQGGFSPPQMSPQMSPAPQYAFQAPYNASSSPNGGTYSQEVKHAAHGGAVELGGSNEIASATSGGQNERVGG